MTLPVSPPGQNAEIKLSAGLLCSKSYLHIRNLKNVAFYSVYKFSTQRTHLPSKPNIPLGKYTKNLRFMICSIFLLRPFVSRTGLKYNALLNRLLPPLFFVFVEMRRFELLSNKFYLKFQRTCSTLYGIRTHTVWFLKPLPLPIGLRRRGASKENRTLIL